MSTDLGAEVDLADVLARAEAIDNPAWDYIKDLPHDTLMSFGRAGFVPMAYTIDEDAPEGKQFISHRDRITSRYCWAIPSPESLAFIVGILNGRSVVEIGAGSGYWAWMLSQLGVDVNAYDMAPIGHKDSWFSMQRIMQRGVRDVSPLQEFHPVIKATHKAIARPENEGRVLFMCWPTMDSWAYEAARAFTGDTIIYIGEGPGGCTADSDFFALTDEGCGCWSDENCNHGKTDARFEVIATGPLVQWGGLHDNVTVYQRKVQT